MAIRTLKSTLHLRPFNRIRSLRPVPKYIVEAQFAQIKEFIRKRLLLRGNPCGSPAHLPPRIHDNRLQSNNLGNKTSSIEPSSAQILAGGQSSGDIPNPDATISTRYGLIESLPPNFDTFLSLDLSHYVPQSKAYGLRKLYVDWHPISDACNNPILGDNEYRALKKLVMAISSATQKPGKFKKELFRWLKQTQNFPSIIQYLTPAAWEALFASERNAMPTTLTIFVAEMMDTHGIKRTEKQECDTIGAIFWNRDRTEATQRWLHFMRSLDNPTADTWNLGIKLLSLRKEPEKAMSIYNMMKESLGHGNPKALVPIILSWNHLYRDQKAWRVFLMLRKYLNIDPNCVKPGYLEDIALSFLDAKQPGGAFAVLRYMWKKGMALPEYTREAAIFYQNIIASPEVLHTFSTNLLDALKDRVSDKYFYASWMKNLVRLGRPDLTLQVKEVMESNGLRPDSQHVNGIIYGFLKDGYAKIAQELAGELIQQRLTKVASWQEAIERKKRRGETQVFGVSIDSLPEELQGPKSPLSPLQTIEEKLNTPPMATTQTFSILLLHFTRRRDYERVQFYLKLMLKCQLPLSAVHMNHILAMHVRLSEFQRLERAFEIMTSQMGCKPDGHTWKLMWYAMWKRYAQHKIRTQFLQTPRQLFTKMTKFIPAAKYGDPLSAWGNQQGSRPIWRVIVRSFLLARDWDGLIVALNAGDSLWKMHVDRAVYKELAFGLLKKGNPGLVRLASGRIVRRKVKEPMIYQAVRELVLMQRNISMKTKLVRVTGKDHIKTEKQWQKAMEKIREIPTEQKAAALELATKMLKKEAGKMDSMVGVERLRDVREEMGLKHVGIKGTLPPAKAQRMTPHQPWMLNLK